MPKPPSTWKKVEQKIADFWGGRRRGADYKNRDGAGGKNDVTGVPGWSIEIKHLTRPSYGAMADAARQAEANRDEPNDIPVAVIHKNGDAYKDSLVVMRLEVFADFFINKTN